MNEHDFLKMREKVAVHMDAAAHAFAQGRFADAAECCRQAIELDPLDPKSFGNYGAVLSRLGKWQEAETALRNALSLQSKFPDANLNLAIALHAQGRIDEAYHYYKIANNLQPQWADAQYKLAMACMTLGKFDEAESTLQNAIAAKPDFADAINSLGNLHLGFARNRQAAEQFAAAIAINPNFHQAHNNLGVAMGRLGNLDDAQTALQQAIAIKSDYHEAYRNLANVLMWRGKFDESAEIFAKAESLKPGDVRTAVDRAMLAMTRGDWQGGLAEFERRYDLPEFRQIASLSPRWSGQPIAGTLLVMHEQGLGDTIFLVRYLPAARQRCGRLIFCCQKELTTLLQSAAGADQIVTDPADVAYEAAVGVMSLPILLGVAPQEAAYLRADAEKANSWRMKLGEKKSRLRIGIAITGNPLHLRAAARDIPPQSLSPLGKIPNVEFHSLSPADTAVGDLRKAGVDATDWSAELTDFSQTAAMIANLDVIIAADTAVAHLAGAMGKQTLLPLPKIPDWRWKLNGDKTDWYPGMELFRQSQDGDWSDVVTALAARIMELTR